MDIKKMFVWHLGRQDKWAKVMDKVYALKDNFQNIHERYLAKSKHKSTRRFRGFKDSKDLEEN